MQLSPTPGRAPAAIDFKTAYQAEFSYVWSSVCRLGVRGPDVQDLTHDVFATAYRRWDTFDPSRRLRPWLFGIAYRLVADFRRKLQNQREVAVEAPVVADNSRTPEEHAQMSQAKDLALRIIDTIDLDRRAVLVMHDIDGDSVPEIAEALGVPLNTAYSRLRLARGDFNQGVRLLQLEGRQS